MPPTYKRRDCRDAGLLPLEAAAVLAAAPPPVAPLLGSAAPDACQVDGLGMGWGEMQVNATHFRATKEAGTKRKAQSWNVEKKMEPRNK